MLYRPASFRKSAFALTTVVALAGASVLSTFPANAQQAVNYTGTAACASYAAGTESALKCAIEQSQLRTKAAITRGAESDRRGAAADARTEAGQRSIQQAQGSTACMEAVDKKIEAAKKAGPLSPDQKVMFKAQIERCDKT
jgi:hypothetical protein